MQTGRINSSKKRHRHHVPEGPGPTGAESDRKDMIIEDEIKRAREKVIKARKAYDAAVEELSRLLDKRDHEDIRARVTPDTWTFKWSGEATWDDGGGTVDCVYEATAKLKPVNGEEGFEGIRGPELRKLQTEQKKFSSEDLCLELGKSLKQMLDSEFESYCDDDDYYQPVVEDFEAEAYMKDWAKERNLEVVQFEGSGSDGGYEPKMRRRW